MIKKNPVTISHDGTCSIHPMGMPISARASSSPARKSPTRSCTDKFRPQAAIRFDDIVRDHQVEDIVAGDVPLVGKRISVMG